MTTTSPTSDWSLTHLASGELLDRLTRLVQQDRQLTAELLAHVAEVDARKLYLDAACPSMFAYCTERLHLSEPAAYKRVRAARVARAFPVVLDMLARGDLHLAAVTVLAPHLTQANHTELLAAAVHKSKRGVEELVAARFPVADVPATVRKLPEPRAAVAAPLFAAVAPPRPGAAVTPSAPNTSPAAPARASEPVSTAPTALRPAVAPLAADRYRIQFTATREVRDRLREAQDLLSHQVPDGDLNAVIGQALDLLVRELKRTRFGATERPRTSAADADGTHRSAHVPNAIKRAVAERDGGQCTFVDAAGRRCQARRFLEYHHGDPQGQGGVHSVELITLRCRGHNGHAAARDYGAAHITAAIAAHRAGARLAPGPAQPPEEAHVAETTSRA
ncbi:MAG TPA: hypothetical protein VGQ83_07200 [Polyangia bacterium]|jgi:hypothetical protein